MKQLNLNKALGVAIEAGLAAGGLMRDNFRSNKKINSQTHHDIKLELDVRCQERIQRIVGRAFPGIALLGEEGVTGDPNSQYRWVIDPIDGTVNFAYGIPHACTSIALQHRIENPAAKRLPRAQSAIKGPDTSNEDYYETVVGVVYDPFVDELWTAIQGQQSRLNNRPIHVTRRKSIKEAIVAVGFAKYDFTVENMLPIFARLARKVRKLRLMGSAALDLVYVATGRMDAYIENNIRLWDIAAGGLVVNNAGGEFYRQPVPGPYVYRILASNGLIRKPLQQFMKRIDAKQ
jgi:myo-inositol-1(or 4)-monophosphatase